MKKTISTVVATALLLGTFANVSQAATPYVNVLLNGKKVSFPDAQPFVGDSGRTMVPVRFITEGLGANVTWNGDAKLVGIKMKDKDIQLKVGDNKAYVNSSERVLDASIVLKDSRTFVPLRFVSESLEADVTWDNASRTVVIVTADQKAQTGVKLDQWGRKIRTTNLPKNAADYPYILEDVPNDMYEMKFDSTYYLDVFKDVASSPANCYAKIPEFKRGNIDLWMDRVRNYYQLLFNVNASTINYSFVDEIFKYKSPSRTQNRWQAYVDWVKQNNIRVEGTVDPEPSMIYRAGGRYYVRSRFEFKFNSFNNSENLFYDSYYPDQSILPIQKGVWYEGYMDVPIESKVGGDWGDSLFVGGITVFTHISKRSSS